MRASATERARRPRVRPWQARTTSATSVCISIARSRAILPQVPVEHRERRGDLRQPVAVAVPWRVRRRQVEQRRQPIGDGKPVLAERRQRARSAAELQRQRFPAQASQPLARARQRAPRNPRASARTASAAQCCSSVRATVAVRRWRPASVTNPSMARLRSVSSTSMPARSSSISAVSMMSCAVAPQFT